MIISVLRSTGASCFYQSTICCLFRMRRQFFLLFIEKNAPSIFFLYVLFPINKNKEMYKEKWHRWNVRWKCAKCTSPQIYFFYFSFPLDGFLWFARVEINKNAEKQRKNEKNKVSWDENSLEFVHCSVWSFGIPCLCERRHFLLQMILMLANSFKLLVPFACNFNFVWLSFVRWNFSFSLFFVSIS